MLARVATNSMYRQVFDYYDETLTFQLAKAQVKSKLAPQQLLTGRLNGDFVTWVMQTIRETLMHSKITMR